MHLVSGPGFDSWWQPNIFFLKACERERILLTSSNVYEWQQNVHVLPLSLLQKKEDPKNVMTQLVDSTLQNFETDTTSNIADGKYGPNNFMEG